jgi:hypothetical protein
VCGGGAMPVFIVISNTNTAWKSIYTLPGYEPGSSVPRADATTIRKVDEYLHTQNNKMVSHDVARHW